MIYKIVQGNSFKLHILVRKPDISSESNMLIDFDMTKATDIKVSLVCNFGESTIIPAHVSMALPNVVVCDVPSTLDIGNYNVSVSWRMDGNDMASVEKNLFRIVEYNSQAQYPICMVEGENCKETKIATAIVVLPATIELWQLVNLTNATLEEADALSKKIADAEALRVKAEKERENAELTRNKQVADAISNINKAQANNIKKIEQTTTSVESGGINVITIITGNGTTSFEVRNGSQGERGLQGERGEKGDMGSIGKVSISVDNTTGTPSATATASKAADGSTDISFSFKGIKGEKGEKGERGEQGLQGIQGLQGERGEQGLPGNDGAKGDKGEAFKYTDFTEDQLAALKGPKGDKGDIGLTGPQGETGPVGPQGIKGDPFTYSDFTEAQIKELQKPATDAATKAEAATTGAEKVDATLANDVLTVTNRKGESTSLQLASYAEVGDVVSEVKHLSEAMGAYSDRPDITLVAKETNKAISADGVKVTKAGWAIAEFTAEKGNEYLFKPNVIDGSVCVFAEYITSIETRGIDYTYTYNEDGTIATATATYLGNTHTYTYEWTTEAGVNTPTIKEGDTVINNLPMTYEIKVGTYSPLVKLNEDAELPVDGYCRYMSHFKGNSSIKIVVSYKVGTADLTMKVLRDDVLASISTQLGNLSQKEDETRKKIEDLHGSYADLLFVSDWNYLYVDEKNISVIPGKKMRVYPKFSLKIGNIKIRNCPLVWCDVSNLDTSKFTDMSYMFFYCTSISNIDVSRWNVGNVTSMQGMFYGCTSLKSLNIEGWNTSSVSNMTNLFNGCKSLTFLNVNNWDVSNVASVNGMFDGNLSLKSINLSNWDTRSIKEMLFFFRGSCDLIVDMSGDKWAFNADVIDSSTNRFSPFYRWMDSNIKSLLLGKNFFAYDGKFKDSLGDLLSNTFKGWDSSSFKKSIVENTYDRKSNGLSVMTLKLYSTLKNYLTEEDIATITAKGYIIA